MNRHVQLAKARGVRSGRRRWAVTFPAAPVLILGLGSGAITTALAQEKQSGAFALAAPDRKSAHGLSARLVVVKNPRAFAEKWLGLDIPKTKSGADVKRGDAVGAFLLFVGCKPNAQGACQAEVDYAVYRPDGSLRADRKGEPLWQEQTFPPPNIQLGRVIPAFRMGRDDPSGEYRVKAKVTDLTARVSLEFETTFRLK